MVDVQRPVNQFDPGQEDEEQRGSQPVAVTQRQRESGNTHRCDMNRHPGLRPGADPSETGVREVDCRVDQESVNPPIRNVAQRNQETDYADDYAEDCDREAGDLLPQDIHQPVSPSESEKPSVRSRRDTTSVSKAVLNSARSQ